METPLGHRRASHRVRVRRVWRRQERYPGRLWHHVRPELWQRDFQYRPESTQQRDAHGFRCAPYSEQPRHVWFGYMPDIAIDALRLAALEPARHRSEHPDRVNPIL